MQLYQRVLQQMDYDVHLSSYAETSSFLRNSHGNSTTSDHGGGGSVSSAVRACAHGGAGPDGPSTGEEEGTVYLLFSRKSRKEQLLLRRGRPTLPSTLSVLPSPAASPGAGFLLSL